VRASWSIPIMVWSIRGWIAQIITQATTRILCPPVAVQRVYMHPYSVAKMVSSLAHLYGRRVCFNMVAGSFKNDLLALDDTTPHDRRYALLIEYTRVITDLLSSDKQVTFSGEFHRVEKLRMTPPLPPELFPDIFVSGSSDAGRHAGDDGRGCDRIPPDHLVQMARTGGRNPLASAWESLRHPPRKGRGCCQRAFPLTEKGELTHQLAMKTSDSAWHRRLSEFGIAGCSPYWLRPFETDKSFLPVSGRQPRDSRADILRAYMDRGFRTFILDIPPNEEDLAQTSIAFQYATASLAPPTSQRDYQH
jgi:alkanesulfonate monooxygenase